MVMTTRQMMSVLLSCVFFSHPVNVLQGLAAAVVFLSLYGEVWVRMHGGKAKPAALEAPPLAKGQVEPA